MGQTVAIIGSRDYTRLTDVDDVIANMPVGDEDWCVSEVISGGARGVDRRAAVMAKRRGIPVREIEPDPDLVQRFGFRHAALTRNREIVEQADVVHAFWDRDSTGTSNAIAHAIVAGKILLLHTTTGVRFIAGGKPGGYETSPLPAPDSPAQGAPTP
jgi:hypothetical protein